MGGSSKVRNDRCQRLESRVPTISTTPIASFPIDVAFSVTTTDDIIEPPMEASIQWNVEGSVDESGEVVDVTAPNEDVGNVAEFAEAEIMAEMTVETVATLANKAPLLIPARTIESRKALFDDDEMDGDEHDVTPCPDVLVCGNLLIDRCKICTKPKFLLPLYSFASFPSNSQLCQRQRDEEENVAVRMESFHSSSFDFQEKDDQRDEINDEDCGDEEAGEDCPILTPPPDLPVSSTSQSDRRRRISLSPNKPPKKKKFKLETNSTRWHRLIQHDAAMDVSQTSSKMLTSSSFDSSANCSVSEDLSDDECQLKTKPVEDMDTINIQARDGLAPAQLTPEHVKMMFDRLGIGDDTERQAFTLDSWVVMGFVFDPKDPFFQIL